VGVQGSFGGKQPEWCCIEYLTLMVKLILQVTHTVASMLLCCALILHHLEHNQSSSDTLITNAIFRDGLER